MKLKSKKKKKVISKKFRLQKATIAKVALLLGLALIVFYMAFYGIYNLGIVKRVEKITISSETVGIKVGAKYQLSVSVYPSDSASKAVNFKSSDEKVAKVNHQGVVTALKKGTALITATSLNNKKVTDSVNIEVGTEEVELKKILLNQSNIFLQLGYKYLIETNFEPSDSNNLELKYTSSNEDVATIDEFGFVKGKTIGKTTITVTDEKTGITEKCQVVVLSSGGETGNS